MTSPSPATPVMSTTQNIPWGYSHPRAHISTCSYAHKIMSHRTCTQMVLGALLTVERKWEQSKCPLTDEWINKMQCSHTMGHYSALKGMCYQHSCYNTDKSWEYYAKWKTQTQKTTYCKIPFPWNATDRPISPEKQRLPKALSTGETENGS